METIDTYILKVRPDQKTGKMPTKKQLEVLMLINPFRAKSVKYADAAKILGVTVVAIRERMRTLKKRCPLIYNTFRKERFKSSVKKRPIKHTTGCVGCGCEVPEGQDMCYGCWREKDRLENPNHYRKDTMFPANGKTRSTVEWDKNESADEWMQSKGF